MAPNSAGMRRRVSQSSIQPHQREVQDDLVRTQTDEGRSENISVSTSNTHSGSQPYHGEENCSLPPMSFSTSQNERTPLRSFYHRSFRGSLDAGQYSSRGVREKTAELASLALFNRERDCTDSVWLEPQIGVPNNFGVFVDGQRDISRSRWTQSQPGQIEELSAADSRTGAFHSPPKVSTSALTTMIRDFAPDRSNDGLSEEPFQEDFSHPDPALTLSRGSNVPDTERTALLNPSRTKSRDYRTAPIDVEGQITRYNPLDKLRAICARGGSRCFHRLNPQAWDRTVIWRKGIVYPITLLPAVFLGLLLNILDALSYGMILFPLGEPLFAHLAPDGISIFYVSTIVAQLVYSCGGSVFKGGVGSEMIEVVPFFHKIAFMILKKVGKQNEKAVLATTILSYAISSVLTGSVFFLMGAFNLGSLIGFFPRHILIGCIGGVGWFLVATGVMVSARLSGNLEYNLETLKRLFQLDTVFLWTLPLIGAIGLLVIKRFVKSNFLVGGYFISMGAVFYIFKFCLNIPLETLRSRGWVFEAPSSSEPWYHFYTLYDFSSVHWSALAETIPAMFALTFFGVLHVPINVPALGISTGEDNLNVDRELLAHGISNAVSGFFGSIQNYLVYTNSLLFIGSGGNSRLAGVMLAFGTFGIMLVGPGIISYIPVVIVGALIYILGIELMEEALVDTLGKLHTLEYLTVVIIVVTMGAWDFVIGIVIGIILACVNFVVQTAQKSAITATYSGQVAISTVRRHPLHVRFLKDAGKQTFVIKLAGFLFFGTIVSVENTVRGLIEEKTFKDQPIRFLILDLKHVNGLDFSAAEAFTRLNRILWKRRVQMIISSIDVEGEIGKSLQNVGLFEKENEVEIFESLNSALEYCENELLKVLYQRKDTMIGNGDHTPPQFLDVSRPQPHILPDALFNSPRGHYLHQVATTALREEEADPVSNKTTFQKWDSFQQPLPLLLQTFHGLTKHNEDFWFPACTYFTREVFPADSVLYRTGEDATNFYLLESGMLRAEYESPQGSYSELIVAGRPCGELPFFGETRRTATVRTERDSVVWRLGSEEWQQLRRKEPMLAQELMKVCFKLTSERMESITGYVLTTV
ncbi:sulfate transporter [Histoplasma capsulatum G186AR]|uniref:Sulfate transporter n=1 Tax=Ajellomyces capsulatus (strain G186AR / H82 / ATCC MYA-2454 / RMSCC 2432) TaxID=447093 RepID=C0NK05_AJECG|nr:sulfate transporter [Histoplasma capsulatum G186AR]EEH08196.1 sulfate transporter [Histoplasma capsulatum G186AR]